MKPVNCSWHWQPTRRCGPPMSGSSRFDANWHLSTTAATSPTSPRQSSRVSLTDRRLLRRPGWRPGCGWRQWLQVLLALAAVAWALPGLWPHWNAQAPTALAPWLAIGDAIAQARALGAEWLALLGALNRATWAPTAEVGATGLWLGVCVAGATASWLAGNSVLLAKRSLRR